MNKRIGLLFSLTGTTAITERGQCLAAEFAIDEYNKTAAQKISPVIRDISSDPAKCVEEAVSLAEQGIKVLVGCYTSSCRKAILPVLEKYNCLLVYPTLYEGRECHSHVFYTGEVPNQQIHTMLDYITRYYGSNVYCIGNDYIYPRETNQQVKNYLNEQGRTLSGESYVPFGHDEFFTTFNDIIEKKPDVILSTLVGNSITPFYQTYHQLNLNPETIPIFSPITKESEVHEMGFPYAHRHYSAGSYFQSLKNEENKSFIQRFHQFSYTDHAISSVMFNTYLGTKLIIEALMKTKSEDYHTLFYELKGMELNTACGQVHVENNYHHLTRTSRIGRANAEGQFEVVWESDSPVLPNPFIEKVKKPGIFLESTSNNGEAKPEAEDVEAVIVLSKDNEISYVTPAAGQVTALRKSEKLSQQDLNRLEEHHQITSYETKDQTILLMKPKPNASPKINPLRFHDVTTVNERYQKELQVAQLAAESAANVLITGETGTGKEVVAKAIHEQSSRRNGPFIAINTGTIPKDLISSELFGYVDGAFSGAKKGGQIGKFEAAHEGTLFLDEIGEMPAELQVSLLRAIEEKCVTRVGDHRERKINVRIIAATNRNLHEEIAYNAFRSDLFYRLNVLSLKIPPLRERQEDIPLLAQHFLQHFQDMYQLSVNKIDNEVIQKFITYPWPGNIRELRNVMERVCLFAESNQTEIKLEYLPSEHQSSVATQIPQHQPSLEEVEINTIKNVLSNTKTIHEASAILGISRSTLYRKMKKNDIE